jgi:hypothetical protein
MFSVTKTGTNFFPLWTASVIPTISGITVDRRDHVFMTRLLRLSWAARTFFNSFESIYGPFFNERGILIRTPSGYLVRFLTIYRLLFRLLRVLYPLVGFPQGVQGWRPPDDLPSPPPMGWSTGFIATPLTLGLRPSHRLRPAFPKDTFS